MELWWGFTKGYAKKSKDNFNQLVNCTLYIIIQEDIANDLKWKKIYIYVQDLQHHLFFVLSPTSEEKKLYVNQSRSPKFLTRKHIQLYLNFVILVKECQLTIPFFFFSLTNQHKRSINKNLKPEFTKRFQLIEIRE